MITRFGHGRTCPSATGDLVILFSLIACILKPRREEVQEWKLGVRPSVIHIFLTPASFRLSA